MHEEREILRKAAVPTVRHGFTPNFATSKDPLFPPAGRSVDEAGVHRRKDRGTTQRDPQRKGYPDLVDTYARKVVGWATDEHFTAELVLGTLEMTLWNRQPAEGVIHHSDQGSQSMSLVF